MKSFKSVLVSMLAGSMMCACSSDPLINNDQKLTKNDGEGVFMALDIQMPTGKLTRSETNDEGGSTGGTEIGTPEENTVTNALVVLAASADITEDLPEFGFIAASEVQNNRIYDLSSATKEYRAIARLQKTNLNMLYEQYQAANITANPEVYVFVFANPTKQQTEYFSKDNLFGDTSWLDMECTVRQGNAAEGNYNIGIWGSNSFLMNNESLTTRLLPKNLLDWEQYNSYDSPFHLSQANEKDPSTDNLAAGGPVSVQRSVARFDFRDGSGTGKNLYKVLYASDKDGKLNENAPIVGVQLQKMCLVNMSNNFYFLPRVSADGMNTNPKYCGKEVPWVRPNGEWQAGNYVVGPYADKFSSTNNEGFYSWFNFSFFENDGQFNNEEMSADRWDVAKISDVLAGRGDNYVGKDNKEDEITHQEGDYKVWRYVTENVIPGVNDQVYGISTGVVFKGRLTGAYVDGQDYNEQEWEKGAAENISNCLNGEEFTYNGKTITKLTGDSKDDPILYYLNGKLYMGWRNIRQATIQEAVTVNVSGQIEINRSGSLYKAVFGDGPIAPTYKITVPDGAGNYTDETKTTVYLDPKTHKSVPVVDPRWDATTSPDDEDYQASPDYAWQKWNGEGKETGDGLNPTKELTAFRKAATSRGISIYQTSIDSDPALGVGYYCYYYYWNRHNDNHQNGVMAPMEFAVVRNNVYKLYVDKISRLGHPRIPDNDPDDPKPYYPDESDYIYLDVKVAIMDWAVRLNSITF